MINIVSATRLNQESFWTQSALGISLRRLSGDARLLPKILFENKKGLPIVFNEFLGKDDGIDVVVFIHDDVWIDDFFIADRILEAVNRYDVFGVVGNKRRQSLQPSWAFLNVMGQWDDRSNLSGAIAHGLAPFGEIGFFGASPADCELLDGVFVGIKKSSVINARVFFDPRFSFHFYDVDFCMQARKKTLKVGTWPIALTHQSTGGYGQGWLDTYQVFCDKWQHVGG